MNGVLNLIELSAALEALDQKLADMQQQIDSANANLASHERLLDRIGAYAAADNVVDAEILPADAGCKTRQARR